MSNSVTSRVQLLIDKKHESMNKWKGTVTMPCYIDYAYDTSVDINCFVASNKKEKVVFCNKAYPITSGWKGEGWEKLLKHLQKAAIVGGFELYGNGAVAQKTVKTVMYIMKCTHGRIKKKKRFDDEDHYRKEYVINNTKCGKEKMVNP